ncbi:MAG TPA: carboxypeptidase regulatory-like domain-containing protein [Vicinamibacterales bacterium]|nr:carboxypeptidase regulatory-like domain-containing protein [Vicinamibacterales bacterium]
MTAVLALVVALQQAPAPPTPAPATPAAPAVQAPRRPVATSTSVQVRVTDRGGAPVQGVAITAEGPVSRDGVTDASGQVQFRTVANGTYRMRAAHEKFITLEKEIVVRGGAASPVEFALSAAPPPPAAPPAPPAPTPAPQPAAAPAAKAGEARVLSIADLAERSLGGREPIKLVPVACSGLDNTQMIVLRETRTTTANAALDEMLYVVAGEATLSIGGREQTVASGFYAMVPRGTPSTITRKGRNPAIILSTVGGQPCQAQ